MQLCSVSGKRYKKMAKYHVYSPSISLILDVEDANWAEEFTADELNELREYGKPLTGELPPELREKLDQISQLV